MVDDADNEPATVFGEKRNYWELHNEITDKYDADMMDRFNTSLDNMLIFVSASGITARYPETDDTSHRPVSSQQ